MTVSAQAGVFSFGLQSAKGTLATEFWRHRASDINYGPVQDLRVFPLEVGGVITPTGAYKAGVFLGGGATVQPRVEGDLGYLLKGMFGAVDAPVTGTPTDAGIHAIESVTTVHAFPGPFTNPPSSRRVLVKITTTITGGPAVLSITGTDQNGTAQTETGLSVNGAAGTYVLGTKIFKTVTGANVTTAATAGAVSLGFYQTNSHTFHFAAAQESLPWMSVRKAVPTATGILYETGKDNKCTSLRMNFPQNGIMSARCDFLGREPDWSTPGGTLYANPFEDFQSVPNTCDVDGFLKLPSFSASEQPITNLIMTLANNLTTPAQEMIIGSPFPDDFVPLSRAVTYQATLKWNDKDLYLDILTGTVSGTTWTAAPFTSDLDVTVKSPNLVPGSATVKYSLQIKSPTVMWNVNGPPILAGGDIVLLPLIGTVLEPSTGNYVELILINEHNGGY